VIIHNVVQGTQAWSKIRAGIPTASRFSEIVTPSGELSKSAPRYMQELLYERIIGRPVDGGFQSKYMALGNEYEDRAVAAYEWERGVTTSRIGFVTTDDGRIGCSPDRFIDEEPAGMVEAKAPSGAVHVGYLMAAAGASKEYKVQMQGQMWVCGKEWNDIVSYCPGCPDAIFRANRDEAFICKLSQAVYAFSDLLEATALDFAARGWIKPMELEAPRDGIGALGLTDEDIRDVMASYDWQAIEKEVR
jgi:YqaJ-like viral recombinase domain